METHIGRNTSTQGGIIDASVYIYFFFFHHQCSEGLPRNIRPRVEIKELSK